MTPAAAALEEILQSPGMPRMLTELTRAFVREQAARRRFLDEVTEDGKHEFINGEHVVHSPVKLEHAIVSQNIFELLKRHSRRHAPGSFVGFEKIMVHLTRNDYEPDVCWFRPDKAATFAPDTMLFPAPDLVVEVLSPSTEKNDRGVKWEDYAAHGVAEYWIVDPDRRTLEQHLLPAGTDTYPPPMILSQTSLLTSPVIPGLAFPVAALFDEVVLAEHFDGR